MSVRGERGTLRRLEHIGYLGALVCLSVTLSTCTGYRPTSFYEESLGRSSGPDFSFRIYNFVKEGINRSDFYLAISNRALQFTREGDHYVASYNVAVRVFPMEGDQESRRGADEKRQIISEQSWTEAITESDYSATTAQAFHVSPRSFSLQPGVYSVIAEVTDEFSKRSIRHTGTLEVADFQRLLLSVSAITVGSRFVGRDGEQKLIPDIIPEMSTDADTHYAYFEIYDKLPGREIILDYKLYRVDQYEPLLFLSPYRRNETAQKLADTLFWSAESTLVSKSPALPVRLQLPPLAVGHYRLELLGRPHDPVSAGGQREIRAQQTFSVWPLGFPDIMILDQQIEVLEYIATPEEFQSLLQAKSREEKQERLRGFWAHYWNREDYYKRVEFANRFFSCLAEGWRTSFGWVYMVLGPPDDIQLAPQGIERWRYTLGSNRILVIPFAIKEYTVGDTKCKSGVAFLDPVLRRELIQRWRKTE